MGFLDNSSFNNSKVVKGTPVGGSSQNLLIGGVEYNPQTTVSFKTPEEALAAGRVISAGGTQAQAAAAARATTAGLPVGIIPSSFPAASGAAQNAVGIATSGLATINQTLGKALDLESKIGGGLRSAIESITGTFDKATDGLAKSISGRLTGLFKDKNVASASTVNTQISDPVNTNLLSGRKVSATAFKVSGIAAGSQAINAGTTRNGSGSLQMAGTTLLTLAKRLQADVALVKNIPNLIASRFTAQRLDGLFTQMSVGIGTGLGDAIKNPYLGSFVSAATSVGIATALGVGSQKGVAQSLSKDVQSFLGTTSSLSSAYGGVDFSGYYAPNTNYSIINTDGTAVYTNRSNVDADTANSILSIAKNSGCNNIATVEYLSSNQRDSLYGLSLILAALEGMSDLVSDILNCSYSSTLWGQLALGNAFTASSGSQIGIAKSILDNVDSPQQLRTSTIGVSILSNQSLTVRDKATVDSIFTTLGTSTKEVMSVPSASSSKYPVYDSSTIAKTNTGLANAVFQNTTITDYFQSRQMMVGSNGKLIYI